MSKTIKLLLLSLALLSQLNANETFTLEPLTITTTAIKTDELKSSDAVEIYTQADIEKAHVRNVYEFLNQQTSVYATSGYGNPFLQKIDMRGFGVGDGYQNIVITINGRKMNNVDMVPQLLSSISPSSIKKIEIIKSGGIVTGGDGANAAVINIITKKSNAKSISFYMGSYGLADSSFYVGQKDEKLAISASGELQKSDGIRRINSNGAKDKNSLKTGSFELTYTPNDALELRLGALATRTDVNYAGTLTLSEYKKDPTIAGASNYGATQQRYDSNVVSSGLSYYINDTLSLNVDVSDEKKKSNYITYSSITDYDYKQLSANLKYDTKDISIKTGVDGFKGDLSRTKLDLTKINKAIYFMSQFRLNDFSIKAGYRYEEIKFEKKNDDIKKDGLSGAELGVNYMLNKKSSMFLNYSHSYESASLDRLFSFFSGTYTGYVKPSQANNYNLGYNYISSKNKLKVALYYIDLKDEIYYYADPTYVNSKNTNINKSHKYGLDLYEKYIISKQLNLAFNYNYVQAIIDDEKQNGDNYAGNKLPGVSNHNLKAILTYVKDEHTSLSISQVYRSWAYAADDFNNNFTQKQDAYYSTNLSYTYAKDNLEVFAKINNLFNQNNGLWIKNDAIYPVSFKRIALAGFKLKY